MCVGGYYGVVGVEFGGDCDGVDWCVFLFGVFYVCFGGGMGDWVYYVDLYCGCCYFDD